MRSSSSVVSGAKDRPERRLKDMRHESDTSKRDGKKPAAAQPDSESPRAEQPAEEPPPSEPVALKADRVVEATDAPDQLQALHGILRDSDHVRKGNE